MTRIRLGILAQILVPILVVLLCSSCDSHKTDNPSARDDKRYSLFTWNSAEAKICFALVIRSQRDNVLRRWFPKRAGKCGIAELKGALKNLPKGTEVLWEELPRRGFSYPSADMMDEIRESAKNDGIDVVYAPILD
jgi:hypothetical protein